MSTKNTGSRTVRQDVDQAVVGRKIPFAFTPYPNSLFERQDLRAADHAVLLAMSRHWDSGVCFACIDTIAKRCGMGRRTVQTTLDRIASLADSPIVIRPAAKKFGRPTGREILLRWCQEGAESAHSSREEGAESARRSVPNLRGGGRRIGAEEGAESAPNLDSSELDSKIHITTTTQSAAAHAARGRGCCGEDEIEEKSEANRRTSREDRATAKQEAEANCGAVAISALEENSEAEAKQEAEVNCGAVASLFNLEGNSEFQAVSIAPASDAESSMRETRSQSLAEPPPSSVAPPAIDLVAIEAALVAVQSAKWPVPAVVQPLMARVREELLAGRLRPQDVEAAAVIVLANIRRGLTIANLSSYFVKIAANPQPVVVGSPVAASGRRPSNWMFLGVDPKLTEPPWMEMNRKEQAAAKAEKEARAEAAKAAAPAPVAEPAPVADPRQGLVDAAVAAADAQWPALRAGAALRDAIAKEPTISDQRLEWIPKAIAQTAAAGDRKPIENPVGYALGMTSKWQEAGGPTLGLTPSKSVVTEKRPSDWMFHREGVKLSPPPWMKEEQEAMV